MRQAGGGGALVSRISPPRISCAPAPLKTHHRTATQSTLETLAATRTNPRRTLHSHAMQRAAARVASLAIRRFASSASHPTAVASLLPVTAVLNAGTRLSVQPTAAAAAAALCARRGYASGARKTKPALSDDEEEDDEFENMGSDEEFDGDFDDEDLDDDDSDDEEEPVKKKRGRC